MTNPYASKIGTLISSNLRHEATVTAVTRAGERIGLDVEDGGLTVTLDESWSPYAQASLTAAIPSSQATLDKLDPKLLVRLEIDAGYTYPDNQTELRPLARLAFRRRTVSRPANTLTVAAASGEARTQDHRLMWNTGVSRAGVNEAATWLIRRDLDVTGDPFTFGSDFPPGTAAAALADFEVLLGDPCWKGLDDLATRTDKRIYCDELGTWRITARPGVSGAGPVEHTLTVGEAGTVLEAETELDREEWYNAVILRYRWVGPDKIERVVYGRAEVVDGAYSSYTVGRRAYFEEYESPISQGGADAAAATKLRNLVTRGRSLKLSAIAAYWLRPGMTVSVTLPTGAPELQIVRRVDFQPLTGRMSLETRQPINVTISTGA